MNEFSYHQAASMSDALIKIQSDGARILAGGTTQLDLMKCNVEKPPSLIDITRLPAIGDIVFSEQSIRVGALVRMSELAAHPQCGRLAPVIYGSLWQAASPQIRNMATIGGNLRQRTRCGYFRDPDAFSACNKRTPGSGCSALEGVNRNHAILGGSDHCVAVYPGDLAVALTAFDAVVILRSESRGERRVPIEDFYQLPGTTPEKEHDIAPDEIIVAVDIPRSQALQRSHYLKIRDRASYEFAAASAAVGLELEGGMIRTVHIALGGVATKPWRARQVENALRGKTFSEENISAAAQRVTADARVLQHNHFKQILAPRAITRALLTAGGMS